MTIKGLTLLLKVYKILAGMCHQSKAATPVGGNGNSEENINMGLLNISSNSQSFVSVETVLEILSFVILALLLCRWIKKCMMKRKLESERRLASIIKPETTRTSSFMEMPSAPRAIMAPVGSMEQMQMGVQQMQPMQPMQGPIGLDKYR